MKQKGVKACVIENDEYFYRDNEMARASLENSYDGDLPITNVKKQKNQPKKNS